MDVCIKSHHTKKSISRNEIEPSLIPSTDGEYECFKALSLQYGSSTHDNTLFDSSKKFLGFGTTKSAVIWNILYIASDVAPSGNCLKRLSALSSIIFVLLFSYS